MKSEMVKIVEGMIEELVVVLMSDGIMDSQNGMFLRLPITQRETRNYDELVLLRTWMEAKVTVSCTATLQSLLACTTTGPLDDEWATSPFGVHATWLDPPIEYDHVQCPVFVGGPTEGRHRIRWVMLGMLNGYAVFVMSDEGRSWSWVSCGKRDDIENELLTSEIVTDFDRAVQQATRVAVGLSRLIKSAPPVDRQGRTKTDHVAIQDHVSKKRGTRSVFVRNVFAVEPRVLEACKMACRRGPRAPCLRHLVRGHWRNQAVGKGRKERNLRWIQPHWKGVMRGIVPSVEVRVR